MPEDVALSPLAYQILLALVGRDRHGYLIRKAVESQTGGSLKPGPGSLYAAIRRLEDAGLIEESRWRPDADLDDRRRRYYRLSATGRAAFRAETERLKATVTLALRHLNARPSR
jgi:DNA-binding PadR family transcriptional regulator